MSVIQTIREARQHKNISNLNTDELKQKLTENEKLISQLNEDIENCNEQKNEMNDEIKKLNFQITINEKKYDEMMKLIQAPPDKQKNARPVPGRTYKPNPLLNEVNEGGKSRKRKTQKRRRCRHRK
jgi:chromosome segregation ATPase